jgi:hypothetical protein
MKMKRNFVKSFFSVFERNKRKLTSFSKRFFVKLEEKDDEKLSNNKKTRKERENDIENVESKNEKHRMNYKT